MEKKYFFKETSCEQENKYCPQKFDERINKSLEKYALTSELCDQTICGGGSGANRTTQVKFIVEPLLINRSGPPWISVIGSVNTQKNCVLIVH